MSCDGNGADGGTVTEEEEEEEVGGRAAPRRVAPLTDAALRLVRAARYHGRAHKHHPPSPFYTPLFLCCDPPPSCFLWHTLCACSPQHDATSGSVGGGAGGDDAKSLADTVLSSASSIRQVRTPWPRLCPCHSSPPLPLAASSPCLPTPPPRPTSTPPTLAGARCTCSFQRVPCTGVPLCHPTHTHRYTIARAPKLLPFPPLLCRPQLFLSPRCPPPPRSPGT
jgi:hypothetical protein